MKINWRYKTPGIPDELFIRGKVPMTKEEIRALSISKLRLEEDSIMLDIGAGTGSISIESAIICNRGKIISIERNPEGVQLVKRNAEKFGVENIDIIEGKAPENLRDIKEFDRVFIGGSGGKLKEILELCSQNLTPSGIVVINAITIETLYKGINLLKELKFSNVDVTSITVSKGRNIGQYTMMEGLNPINIVSGMKE